MAADEGGIDKPAGEEDAIPLRRGSATSCTAELQREAEDTETSSILPSLMSEGDVIAAATEGSKSGGRPVVGDDEPGRLSCLDALDAGLKRTIPESSDVATDTASVIIVVLLP
jgi:hypothetical protein